MANRLGLVASQQIESAPAQERPYAHCLGPVKGWRTRRLLMAISLKQAGWSLERVANHLNCATFTITRDIAAYQRSPRSQMAHGMRAAMYG